MRATDIRYVLKIAREFGLGSWEINVVDETEDNLASCRSIDGAHEATIALSEEYQELSPDEKRETVVHEVLHIFADPAWQMIQVDLPPLLGLNAITPFHAAYKRLLEFQIDGLAKAVAPRFPLP